MDELKLFKKEVKRVTKNNERLKDIELRKIEEQKHIDWRNKVYERDNWTCQLCNTSYKDKYKFKGLQPMHILSKENYPQFRYDVMNGLSGCFFCHKNSGKSPHLDCLAFCLWLLKNRPEQYKYLVNLLNSQ